MLGLWAFEGQMPYQWPPILVRYCVFLATGDRDTYRCQNLRGQNLIGTHLDLTLSYTAMGFVSVCTSYCHFFQTSTQ